MVFSKVKEMLRKWFKAGKFDKGGGSFFIQHPVRFERTKLLQQAKTKSIREKMDFIQTRFDDKSNQIWISQIQV